MIDRKSLKKLKEVHHTHSPDCCIFCTKYLYEAWDTIDKLLRVKEAASNVSGSDEARCQREANCELGDYLRQLEKALAACSSEEGV